MTLTQVEPAPHRNDFELTNRLRELFEQCRDQKRKYQTTWRRNYLLATNRQYALDVQQPWSPNLTDSEIFPILSARVAWMTDQKISPEVAPAAEPNSPYFQYLQTLGENLQSILRSVQNVDGWDGQVVQGLWDAAMFGAGIFKATWDSGLTDGLGNIALKRIDPWKFYPDANCTSFEDCDCMFYVSKMTKTEIERRFPGSGKRVIETAVAQGTISDQSSRPGPSGGSTYPMAMPGNLPTSSGGTVWGLPGQTNQNKTIMTEGVNIYEAWVRENDSFTRQATDPDNPTPEPVTISRWRVVIYSNDIVLLDEYAENLWQEDRHPFFRYVDEEMGEFWPVPLASHLAPAQIAINRLLSAMQGNAELVGNPIFMDVSNSGLVRTQIVNRPGVRLTMDAQAANGNVKPDWLQPPTMSSLVPELIQFWISRMENISGLSGVAKGQAPGGRQAQQTIQATQEAASVRIRSSLRNLERALGDAYTLLAHLVIQNYSVPRVVAIIGTDGVDDTIRLAARHFYSPTRQGAEPMKFSLIVQAGSSNPTSRPARIAEADALFAMKAIDVPAVLEAHAFPNWQKVWQRLEEQQAKMLQVAELEHKEPHGPGTGHEH